MKSPAKRDVYPFAAIVGQEGMKLGLILNVIDPLIGGVLLMGHRGTGKSTAVRALADLLPLIWTVRDCRFNCDPANAKQLCAECTERLAGGHKLKRERSAVPVVDLPLGATEDRVCGAIDIERALGAGLKKFEPGLLARANRGFLYIDEVNLLEDHLVDLLLDVSITGRNQVERENISIEHPARFVLIGSGNPEEGELRPQLLDRFGLYVEVTTENDTERRVEIVEQREAFERDPEKFCAALAPEQKQLRQQLARASQKFTAVRVGRPLLRQIALLCSELKVDGHRGELTIMRAARALAAFESRKAAGEADVRRVAMMALRHRLHRDPLGEQGSSLKIEQALDKAFQSTKSSPGFDDDGFHSPGNQGGRRENAGSHRASKSTSPVNPSTRRIPNPNARNGSGSEVEAPAPPASDGELPKLRLDNPSHLRTKTGAASRGRRAGLRSSAYDPQRGRYTRAVALKRVGASVALLATLRTAIFRPSGLLKNSQPRRTAQNLECGGSDAALDALDFVGSPIQSGVALRPPQRGCPVGDPGCLPPHSKSAFQPPARDFSVGDLRYKQFARKNGTLFIFAIDASGSMALNRINQAKGALLRLLAQSYINRDSIAVVAFKGTAAEVLLAPSRSIARARRVLDTLTVGGGTPLSAGLACSVELTRRARLQHSGEIVLLLFTDGHANVSLRAEGMTDRSDRRLLIESEVKRLASELANARVAAVVVDTQNPFASNDEAVALAENLGARYVQMIR